MVKLGGKSRGREGRNGRHRLGMVFAFSVGLSFVSRDWWWCHGELHRQGMVGLGSSIL